MTTKPLKYTAKSGVISFFYIKPQQGFSNKKKKGGGVISFFYIKPQPKIVKDMRDESGVISFFYIKPQLM